MTFLRKDRPGKVRLQKGMAEPDDKSVAEQILNAPTDKVLEKPLERRVAQQWPKKSLIRGRKNALATVGLNLEETDPDYKKCLTLSDNYRKHRARELVVVHGFVSAGVSSLLASAALALAASRYLYERAGKESDVSLLVTASKLADSARQHELAAWELCKRESVDRKKAAAAQEGVPWIVSKAEKVGPGRPKKVDQSDGYRSGAEINHGMVGHTSQSSATPYVEASATGSDDCSDSGEPNGGSVTGSHERSEPSGEPSTGPDSSADGTSFEQFLSGVPVRPMGDTKPEED